MSTIQLKKANCRNCYKCIRSCPVKAISFNDEQASIIQKDCILCGKCIQVCPQNAKFVRNDVDKVKNFIQKNEKVYASIAPSFVSAFDCDEPRKIFGLLGKLGFLHVEETAIGAVQVSKEYDKLLKAKTMKNIISTACPTITALVEKYYEDLIPQLAPVVSPVIAHAKMMREMYGSRIRIVFIGPCISKKDECSDPEYENVVDAVITFEELKDWMYQEDIDFDSAEADINGLKNPYAAFYPAPGGIIKTLDSDYKKNYKCIGIDGVDRCMEILDSVRGGTVNNYFFEMNACDGGCLGGPCMKKLTGGYLEARERIVNHTKKHMKDASFGIVESAKVDLGKKFKNRAVQSIVPDDETIREILQKIGKFSESQLLNCSACGYSSCKEKAVAVFNNKADLNMCLPYMRERAESFSNIVINATPNAIVVLDQNLNIQDLNFSAEKLLGKSKEDIKGNHIYKIMFCEDFQLVSETRDDIVNKKYYYEEFDLTMEQSILYLEDQHLILVIMKDITQEEKQKQNIYKLRADAVDIAQKVIDNQMRVAQEIASLLGETTAETKIALTKLKKSMQQEESGNT